MSDSVRRISNRSLESDRFLLVAIGFMTMLGWADSVRLSVSIEKIGPAANSCRVRGGGGMAKFSVPVVGTGGSLSRGLGDVYKRQVFGSRVPGICWEKVRCKKEGRVEYGFFLVGTIRRGARL